jgi:diguanylate cyclase (GGDEF)-like protein/PAS domain S-box-containing protein
MQSALLLQTPEMRVPDYRLPITHLSDAYQYFPDAVIVTDVDTRVSYLNPVAEQLLGCTLDRVRGQMLDEILTLLDRVTQRPVQVCSDFSSQQGCCNGTFQLLQRTNGNVIPVQYSVTLLPGESGISGGCIISLRNASDLQRHIDKLTSQMMHDEHTQLLRRAELVKRLWRLLKHSDANERHAFMYLDLDNFKGINDTAGHAAGDLAIRQIAGQLKKWVRDRDTLARLGGDEFGLLLEHCPAEHARQRAMQLHQAVESYNLRWEGKTYRLGISIGLLLFKTGGSGLNAIMAAADAACYRAKRVVDKVPHIEEVTLN